MMFNLIKADIFRIIRGKGIYIIFAVTLAMIVISVPMKEPGMIGSANSSSNQDIMEAFDDEDVDTNDLGAMLDAIDKKKTPEQKKQFTLKFIGTNMNLYYMMIFIVFCVLVADFSNHTVKNTLSSVFTKKQYYFSKYAMILGLVLTLVFFNTIVCYIINMAVNGSDYSKSLGTLLAANIRQLPVMLGLAGLLNMLGYVLKKPVAYNSVTIAGVLMFQLVLSLAYQVTELSCINTFLTKYEAQGALFKLATDPEPCHTAVCCVIGLTVFAVSTIVGYIAFQKSEIE